MIFIDAAKNTIKMNYASFHKDLMSRGEMANISKLVRFFYQPDTYNVDKIISFSSGI